MKQEHAKEISLAFSWANPVESTDDVSNRSCEIVLWRLRTCCRRNILEVGRGCCTSIGFSDSEYGSRGPFLAGLVPSEVAREFIVAEVSGVEMLLVGEELLYQLGSCT